jgi:hypothetical protein
MPAPLPPQIEPEPNAGDDLFAPEIMAEITNQEHKHGIYTAARFEKLRPVQAKMCVKFLADGMHVQDISRALSVSDRTVTAMADKHADEITDLEKRLGKKAARCAHYLLERVERNPGIIPAQAIGQTVRQFYEVSQLAAGRPTEIIEEVKRVDIYAHWRRFLAGEEIGLCGKKLPPIDAELAEPATLPAAEVGKSDAGAGVMCARDPDPESGLRSDVLALVSQEKSSLATPLATPPGQPGPAAVPGQDQDQDADPAGGSDPAAAIGGGGDRHTRARGAPANDNGSRKFYANGD